MRKALTVGSELDSYCGRCKLTLNHAVVAMVDGAPRRVRCLTCSSEHNHRIPSTRKSKSSSGSTKRASRPAEASSTLLWRQALAEWDGNNAKPYSIFESFEEGDWLSHTKFGNGVVTQSPSPDRIIALFETGEKMLIQGKQRR